MWAGPPDYSGTYDVEEGVAGIVRTSGPVITVNGAWAQNIGENEMYIDFIGDEGGIRLQYGADFTLYSTKNGMLTATTTAYPTSNHFENEINAFVDCVRSGKKLPSHIDTNILTSRLMQAMYDSAESHREIVLE
jgi:predicted dehydrogenase